MTRIESNIKEKREGHEKSIMNRQENQACSLVKVVLYF